MLLALMISAALADTFQALPTDEAPRVVRQGVGVRLVHVWATWCGPCVGEFDRLDEVTTDLASQGLSVVALSIDRSDGPLEAFLSRKTTRMHHYRVDDWRKLPKALAEVDGAYSGVVPYNLLLAADGSVLASWSGTTSEAHLRDRIEPHLRGTGSSGPTPAQLAAVKLGVLTLTLPGREGDAVFIDNWMAGVLPLESEIVGGFHDLRVEGRAGTVRFDQYLLEYTDGRANIDLSQLGGTAPPEG